MISSSRSGSSAAEKEPNIDSFWNLFCPSLPLRICARSVFVAGRDRDQNLLGHF
jgi:hypothetical protein